MTDWTDWIYWIMIGGALFVTLIVPLAILIGRTIAARDLQIPRDDKQPFHEEPTP